VIFFLEKVFTNPDSPTRKKDKENKKEYPRLSTKKKEKEKEKMRASRNSSLLVEARPTAICSSRL